jgi:PAS domain S-box-containing protein
VQTRKGTPADGRRASDPPRKSGGGHLLQLYDSDSFLLTSLARFVERGFVGGEAVVLIATEAHREGLERRLLEQGIDAETPRAAKRYVVLDAAQTLSSFMIDGWPNESRFREHVGTVVADAAMGGNRRVRAFGEMVALLWSDGKADAAIRLEELWNELAKSLPFTLLCGYPLEQFAHEADGGVFRTVCDAHSDVLPAESYASFAGGPDHLRAVASLQQKAKALDVAVLKRDEAEHSRRRSERELADFFENAAVGFHLVGPDGVILRANRAELEMLGYEAEEYIGHHIAEFHVDQDVIDDILRRLTCGETLRGREARVRCKDGSIKYVVIDSNALFDDGKFVNTRCSTQDITARKELEAERERLLAAERLARGQAEAASRAKDEFLSVISHELRTPLGAILGWAAVLKADAGGEKAAQAIATIERSGRLQAKLIEDLLDTSRIISGRMRLDFRLVDVSKAINDALDSIGPTAQAKGVRLQVRLDPAVGPISGDADRLQQIMWNLLSNAVKFTPAGGLVELTLDRRDSDICLSVKDSGRGVPREFLPFLFERFRQSESPASRRSGGLGLGLAIARHLVELHGGSITAASDGDGQGATFSVTFPLPPVPGEVRERTPNNRLRDLRILIVEDNFDAQDALRQLLEREGARVTSAGSVHEALDVLGQLVPDAVVTDLRLPDGDGASLLRQMRTREQLRGVPAIAVSGYDDDGALEEDAYQIRLRKPVATESLIAILAGLVPSVMHVE